MTLPRPETVSEAQKAQQMDNVELLFMAENTWLSTNRPQSVVTLAALISVIERERAVTMRRCNHAGILHRAQSSQAHKHNHTDD